MLIDIFLLGLFQGGFTIFLDFCIWQGIFKKWGEWIERNDYPIWTYPLGACSFCTNVWLLLPTLIIMSPLEWSWLYFIGMVGISHTLIRKINV